MRIHKLSSLLFLCALAGACEEPDNLLQDGEYSAIAVYGQVRDPQGAAVRNATVTVSDVRGGCEGGVASVTSSDTDAAGNYRMVVGSWGQSYTSCLRVQVTPPAGTGLAAYNTTRPSVTMKPSLDSVRVDLELARAQ